MNIAKLVFVTGLVGIVGCARAAAPVARIPAPAAPLAEVTTTSATMHLHPTFAGEGTLEAHGTKLALERLDVTATTTGDVAETTIEHVFRNDSSETLEGTFRFPVPDGAMLIGLAMEIDGKLSEGELVERDKARKAYEESVDKMIDPALLEWENGGTFKLRVFPIEPNRTKRVVLRLVSPLQHGAPPQTPRNPYLTPDTARVGFLQHGAPLQTPRNPYLTPDTARVGFLQHADGGLFFAFRAPSADAHLTTEQVNLVVDGQKIAAPASGSEVLVRVADVAPAVITETTKDGVWFVAHVRPELGAAPGGPAAKPVRGQALIALCDRSRSMLEARSLQKSTLGLLVDRLGDADRFTVIDGDVRAHALGGLHGKSDKDAALGFVDAIEPDGASDLGALVAAAKAPLAEARAQGLEPVVVYLGDGTATWGETRAGELEKLTRTALGGAALHVVALGKSTDEEVARALAAGGHGRLFRPKTEDAASSAANEVLAARTLRRVESARIEGADEVLGLPATIYEGDDVAISLRAAQAPASVRLLGTQDDGKPYVKTISLEKATTGRHVAQRWAKAKIEDLERSGAEHKQQIIDTSLAHGVMSKYTSFLVLESDEAYARFQIERKAKADGEAAVSGNVDGDSRDASVSPDHLQPGDPEVRIPAPADAQSVVVDFPFGETKTATYERDEHGGAWVVRFLVDQRTPDGTYSIVVRITHHDGRIEIVNLPYTVDTQRPNVDLELKARRDGGFDIHAKQRLTVTEQQNAQVFTDAKRVEVRTPDGQTIALTAIRLGEFVGKWIPKAPLAAGAKVRVVTVDRALNERIDEIAVPQ